SALSISRISPHLAASELRFFFFQAEDGIRDRNVTGVQTCALPIWFDLSDAKLRRAGLDYHDLAHVGPSVAGRPVGTPRRPPCDQIGRASCRERVAMSVVDAAVEYKRNSRA